MTCRVRRLTSLALAVATLSAMPAVAESPLQATAVELHDAAFQGAAVGLRSDAFLEDGAPAGSFRLVADELVVRSDSVRTTSAVTVQPQPSDPVLRDDAYRNATMTGATFPGGQELLLAALEGAVAAGGRSARLMGSAADGQPVAMSDEHGVGEGRRQPTFDAVGTRWSIDRGQVVVEGSFRIALWSWDLEVRDEAGRSDSYAAGIRETPHPAAPEVPTLVLREVRQTQVVVEARGARLELDAGGLPVEAFLPASSAEWRGSAAFLDAVGLPVAPPLQGPGRLEATGDGSLLQLRLLPPEGARGPASTAAMPMPGAGTAMLLALPLLLLVLGVPGAGLPWLRRRHEFRLAEAEAALEGGRFEQAIALAAAMRRSRWFAVDAAAVGAEAALRLHRPDEAVAFLDTPAWRARADPLRGLLQARAALQTGDRALATRLLRTSLRAAPDLEAQALGMPGLRTLAEGPRSGEGYA